MLSTALFVRAERPPIPTPVLGGSGSKSKPAVTNAAPTATTNVPAAGVTNAPKPAVTRTPKAAVTKAPKVRTNTPAAAATNAPAASVTNTPSPAVTNAPAGNVPATTNTPAAHPAPNAPAPAFPKDLIPAPAIVAPEAPPAVDEHLTLAGRMMFPSDAMWNSGMGAEFQWRLWRTESFGLAFAAGVESWSIKAGELDLHDTYAVPLDIEGDALTLPVGASLLYRQNASDDIEIILEAGLRYLFADSSVSVRRNYTDHRGREVRINDTVPLDGRFAGIAGIEMHGHLDAATDWFVGAGYRIDFGGGENWLYEEIANDLGGAWAGAGLRRKL